MEFLREVDVVSAWDTDGWGSELWVSNRDDERSAFLKTELSGDVGNVRWGSEDVGKVRGAVGGAVEDGVNSRSDWTAWCEGTIAFGLGRVGARSEDCIANGRD